MNKLNLYVSISIIFGDAMNLPQVALAQYNVPIQPPVPSHDIMFPRKNRKPNQSICDVILSSEWKYYQRMRSSGAAYPTAEAVRTQRKWENKKGCPHLYEANGTVNRVKGINY